MDYIIIVHSGLIIISLISPQLSVQLQQSSEYWSKKVRELSIDLEKCRQDHHSHMY